MKTKKFINRLENAKKVVSLQRKTSIKGQLLTLGYGVMVTLQILVLSFLVRVRVSQQVNASLFEVRFLFASIRDKPIYKRLDLLYFILYAIDTSA